MTEHFLPASHGFKTSLLEEADGPARNPSGNRTMGEIIATRFSPMVGLPEGLWAGPSASSSRLVLKPWEAGGKCSVMGSIAP